MCNLSGIIEERGIERGIEQGKIYTLISLVADGLLRIEDAADKLNVSVEEFKDLMKNI